MAHQSLYRTHRPQKFRDVVGQEPITETLEGQIKSGKVAHAYLFAGSRGLGKTSVARIFARELGTTERDLYEIDAASNNSVDDVRALTENIYTLPFESTYKVYILDEAHMLSKGAWNAFLKTLEEPPAYAIFILATTELSKVPETVQSRCQVYEFKKPSRAVLAKVITDVAKAEGRALEPAAADLIALLGDGSYRDALSTLEKVLAATAEGNQGKNSEKNSAAKVTRIDAERATGAPKHELVHALVEALAQRDAEANAERALATIRRVATESVDMSLYLSLVLDLTRAVLLARHAPELAKDLEAELGADEFAAVKALADSKDSKLGHRTLKALLDAAERLRFSPVPSLPLELAVLELLDAAK